MHWTADELDTETLAKAERECLTRPSPAAFWDDRLYRTHGPVLSWAERGDDILAESNYLTVLAHLQGTAVHDQPDGDGLDDPDEYVIDATISDWLVGSLRQVFVQVRDPETGDYTRVFRESVAVSLGLQDYPVFDESDYSEREWDDYAETLDDAMTTAAASYDEEDFSDAEIDDAKQRVYDRLSYDGQWSRSEDVDWTEVDNMLREALTEH